MLMFTAQQVREIRESLKMTLTEFAARLGVSYGTVMSWESGRRHPKYDHMAKLNDLKYLSCDFMPSDRAKLNDLGNYRPKKKSKVGTSRNGR